jgi:hypothetical protein
MAPITIIGHKAYGVYIIPGMDLRINDAIGLANNDEPKGIYMVRYRFELSTFFLPDVS